MRTAPLRQAAAALLFCTALTSCAQVKEYVDFDTNAGVSKQQYEGLEGRHAPAPQARGEEPPIPGFQSVLAAPGAPELADTRRVSLAVTESTPVRDILIELARKAQVDLEMDPRISGGVIMTATDRPFLEVVGRISDLAELRYKYERNTLKMELDDPYLEQYRMDILNVSRSATSSASSSTDAASTSQAIGGGGGGGGNNKSSTDVNSTTTSNFWGAIGGNINQILTSVQSRRGNGGSAAGGTYVPEVAKAPAAAGAPPPPPPPGGEPPPGARGGGGGRPPRRQRPLRERSPPRQPAVRGAAREAPADSWDRRRRWAVSRPRSTPMSPRMPNRLIPPRRSSRRPGAAVTQGRRRRSKAGIASTRTPASSRCSPTSASRRRWNATCAMCARR